MRRASEANRKANVSAPTVVSPSDTRLIGPYTDSEVGRLKMPTPMMLPTISAVAVPSPKPPPLLDVLSAATPWATTRTPGAGPLVRGVMRRTYGRLHGGSSPATGEGANSFRSPRRGRAPCAGPATGAASSLAQVAAERPAM